jgi:DNA-directed RNA polymerase specialized sigma24 family protein
MRTLQTTNDVPGVAQSLIARLSAGQEEAFAEFAEQYKTEVQAIIRKSLGRYLRVGQDDLSRLIIQVLDTLRTSAEPIETPDALWLAIERIAVAEVEAIYLRRVNAASNSGLAELYVRNATPLRAWAARKMGYDRKAGPESVVMSTMASAIRGFRRGGFVVTCTRRLFSLLATILIHKIVDRAKPHGAKRPSVEPLLDGIDPQDGRPGVQEEAAIADLHRAVLEGLHADYGRVQSLWLQGYKLTEIARLLGIPYSRVKSMADRLRRRYATIGVYPYKDKRRRRGPSPIEFPNSEGPAFDAELEKE